MEIRRCSTGLLLTGGLSVAAVLLASPASAATPAADSGGAPLYAGQKSLSSPTVPICYKPGSVVPVNIGAAAESGASADTGAGPTTCYGLSYHYDPATTTWLPSLSPACAPESVDSSTAEGKKTKRKKEARSDHDWFRDKDRSFDDIIIGSITIGVGGPTIGGTGIVGGAGNTAGGTTVGFGGNTAGGTTVGGFGNTVNNSGTTINGAAAVADLAGVTGTPDLPTCPPTAPATVSQPTSATDPTGQTSTDYERGWTDGWDARSHHDGADADSWSWDKDSKDSGRVSEPVL